MSTLKNGRPTSAAFDRDRIAALTGVILVVAAGWIYLLRGTGVEMAQMDMGDEIAMMTDWTPAYTALTFVMWATMMTVMMLPSAHPALDRIVSYDCDRSPQASSILAAYHSPLGTSWSGSQSDLRRRSCSERLPHRECYLRRWPSAATRLRRCW